MYQQEFKSPDGDNSEKAAGGLASQSVASQAARAATIGTAPAPEGQLPHAGSSSEPAPSTGFAGGSADDGVLIDMYRRPYGAAGRFGDVSLTLGLRHGAGGNNAAEKGKFSAAGDFGGS